MTAFIKYIPLHFLVVMACIVGLSPSVYANTCNDVFTGAVASHSPSGVINFIDFARVKESGTTLDIGIGSGAWSQNCDTGACTSSGNIASSISLPSFQRTSTSNSITFSANTGAQQSVQGDYDQLIIGMNTQVTLTKVTGLSRIDTLQVGMNSRLILAEGDYWVENLEMAENAELFTLNNEKIRLFVENYSETGSNVKLNEYRSPENFVMVAYSDLNFRNNTNSSGFFYVDGDLVTTENRKITGAVNAKNITIGSNGNITFSASALSNADFGDLCEPESAAAEPIAHWSMDICEIPFASKRIEDGIGSSDIQTNEGASINNDGKLCQALRLDGQQDILSVAHNSDFEITEGSVSFWMNTDQLNFSRNAWLNEMVVFSKDRSGFNTGGHMRISVSPSGVIRVRHQTTDTSFLTNTASLITENTWHHVVYSWASDGAKIYVDGNLAASNTSVTASLIGNQETLVIGANAERYISSNGTLESQLRDFYKGSLDELKIFDKALTQAQITTEFIENRIGCESCLSNAELVSHWDLDLCNVSSDADAVLDVVSGNNGTIVNGVSSDSFGRFCQAFDFDGNQSYVKVPHNSNMEFSAGAISLWVNIPDLSHESSPRNDGNAIFSKDNQNFNTGGHLTIRILDNGALRARHQSTNDSVFFETSGGFISENTWHHIVYSFGSEGIRFYVDGVLIDSNSSIRTFNGNREFIVFGASARININSEVQTSRLYDFFKGKMDDIKLYKHQPSAADVDSWYRESSYACNNCDEGDAVFLFEDSTSDNVLNTGSLSTSAQVQDTARIELPTLPKFCNALYVPENTSANVRSGLDTDIDFNDFAGTQGSVSFWYKADQAWNDGNSRQLFDASQEASTVDGVYQSDKHMFLVKRGDGSLRFGLEDSNDTSVLVDTGTNSFSADTWVYISVSWNLSNNEYKIYINGGSASSVTRNSISIDEYGRFSKLLIGDNSSNYFVNDSSPNSASGYFDNVVITQFALSDADALAAYQNDTVCETLHHYEIIHPSTALTCDSADIEIKACANADCSQLFSQSVTVTMSPSTGWANANTLNFSQSTSTTLSSSSAGNVSISVASASEAGSVVCSNACSISFEDAGFRFVDATSGITLSQPHTVIAQSDLGGIAIQAVKNDAGVCAPALSGTQSIDLSYTCDGSGSYAYSPASCSVPFAGVGLSGSAVNSGSVNLTFDSNSTATFAGLSYADVGRLKTEVSGVIEGANISSGELIMHSIPQSLNIQATTSDPITADETFVFNLQALGALGGVMPSFQANQFQADFRRITPSSASSKEASFTYGTGLSINSLADSSAAFQSISAPTFTNGAYTFSQSKLDEVGNYSIAFKDLDYLGSEITSNTLTFARVIPAYFELSLDTPITIADQCSNTFSYVGQTLDFVNSPIINVTAYSADGTITQNYSDSDWLLRPSQSTYAPGLSINDTSTYSGAVAISDVGTGMSLSDFASFTGKGVLSFSGAEFAYQKIANPSGTDASPFNALIDLSLDKSIFTDSDGVCYQSNYPSSGCEDFVVEDITGTELRYGRLNLINTFGPESNWLYMPIQVEYLMNGRWRLNNEDSCTSIAFSQSAGELLVTHDTQSERDISGLLGSLSSTGTLLNGLSDSLDLRMMPPLLAGEPVSGSVNVTLAPQLTSGAWNDYLNIDWDLDGDIDSDDSPSAIATFGIYRGNDRIIHWREVFNE